MQYLIIPDKYHPTHTAPGGATVRVKEYPATAKIQTGFPIRKDLTGYTALPAETPGQMAAADAARRLDQAKSKKLAAIQAAYDADLAAGVTVNELTLAAGESDRAAFTQGLVLVAAAESLGAVNGDTMVSAVFGRTVTDAAGAGHDMTVAQYRALILAYGAAIGAKQGALATKTADVNAATTIEQVNAVQ